MAKRILAFGEILWDILPEKTVLGGAPFNFTFRVNSLGDVGLFASSLGVDELGERALAHVRELGIPTSLMQHHPDRPTGTVDVSFDKDHMPDYVINPDVAYDHIRFTDELAEAAQQAECLCFGTLIQRGPSRETLHEVISAAHAAVKFLDINLRKNCFSHETILYSLEKANILKLNDDEVMQLNDILGLSFESFPSFCEFVAQEFNLDYILITLGERGAFAGSSLGEQVYLPGYKIDLADSLGSGDAFSAAFVHSLLGGHSLQAACELGNALGALVATTHGGTTVISADEIVTLLQSNSQRCWHPEFS
jgi:fructokinase